ncbi:hypothetical protein HJFPF1_10966 [Paramyrothecium foliicola]|nr:hypothetical protein HJFPF1_10966 [Paramyrothecium foliicola]
MRCAALFATALVAGTTVCADVLGGPQPTAVVRRDEKDLEAQMSCIASLMIPPLPSNTDIIELASTGDNECAVYIPATLSSDYNSYAAEVTEWVENLSDTFNDLTSCGVESTTLTPPFTDSCTDGSTVIFTGAGGAEEARSTYAPLPVPTEIRIGAASRNNGMICVSITLAGLVAAVMAL